MYSWPLGLEPDTLKDVREVRSMSLVNTIYNILHGNQMNNQQQ